VQVRVQVHLPNARGCSDETAEDLDVRLQELQRLGTRRPQPGHERTGRAGTPRRALPYLAATAEEGLAMSAYTQGPVVILTAVEARMLWQAANLDAVRIKYRGEDNRIYRIVHDIYQVGLLHDADAVNGNEPRQSTASEKTEVTTVGQVARRAGIAERTVRLHISQQILPATKHGREWVITTADADIYIAARRKN
jgi:hypothetical protein